MSLCVYVVTWTENNKEHRAMFTSRKKALAAVELTREHDEASNIRWMREYVW